MPGILELIEEYGKEKALEMWREDHDRWVAENPPPDEERRKEIVANMRRSEVKKRGTIRV